MIAPEARRSYGEQITRLFRIVPLHGDESWLRPQETDAWLSYRRAAFSLLERPDACDLRAFEFAPAKLNMAAHPRTGARIALTSPLPAELQEFLNTLEGSMTP